MLHGKFVIEGYHHKGAPKKCPLCSSRIAATAFSRHAAKCTGPKRERRPRP